MDKILFLALGVLFTSVGMAQGLPAAGAAHLKREVQGQTITSKELPAADLTFGKDFQYLGGQVVNLYGNADAEQHLFVSGASSGIVRSFYWIQFEHFLPTNQMTYDYALTRTTDIGGLQFIYDVKSFPNYEAVQTDDPTSDGAAIARLLAQHNFSFPKRAARVRMFHLPTADRRTELMIIYGELLAEDSPVPVGNNGIVLDDASPDSARMLLDRAREGLTIRKR